MESKYYANIIRLTQADSTERNPPIAPSKYLLKTVTNDVYKYQPKYERYLVQSPWDKTRARLMSADEDWSLFQKIDEEEAGRILNEQWDGYYAEWVHDCKTYCTREAFSEKGTTLNQCPEHRDNYGLCFFIGYYRGHLYKVVYYKAWDDISFVELRPYEERHKHGGFVNFRVRTKHVKTVFCKTDNKYI